MKSRSYIFQADDGKNYSVNIRKRDRSLKDTAYYARIRISSDYRYEKKLSHANSYNQALDITKELLNKIVTKQNWKVEILTARKKNNQKSTIIGNKEYQSSILQRKGDRNFHARLKIGSQWVQKSLAPAENIHDAEKQFNKWIKLIASKPIWSLIEKGKQLDASAIEELLDKKGASYKSKLFEEMKDRFENLDELTKHKERVILSMKRENKNMKEMEKILGMTRYSIKSRVKKMKLRGLKIPNDKSDAIDYSEASRTLANKIEFFLDQGASIGFICRSLSISPETARNTIYTWFIKT